MEETKEILKMLNEFIVLLSNVVNIFDKLISLYIKSKVYTYPPVDRSDDITEDYYTKPGPDIYKVPDTTGGY